MIDSKHRSFEDNVRKLEMLVKPQSLKDFFLQLNITKRI